jgi:hypothetical protein
MKTQEEKNEEHGKECAVLVVKIQNGDKDAEAELYIKCKTMLMNYAKNLCKNLPDAKDALSKAWEKGLIKIRSNKYKEGNRFPGFICTIMNSETEARNSFSFLPTSIPLCMTKMQFWLSKSQF